jgi:hypothetical protein
MCRGIHRFNRDLETLGAPPDDGVILKGLLGAASASLPIPDGLRQVARVRDGAARLARQHSNRVERGLQAAFILIFLAVTFFHLYSHRFTVQAGVTTHQPLFLAAFLLLVAIAAAVAVWVRRGGIENRALDYRSLAEALRIQFYWGAAGLGESVADHYLEQVHSELAWVRWAVQACLPRTKDCCRFFDALAPEQQCALLNAVAKKWLEGQKGYFDEHARANERRNKWFRWGGLGLASLGWLLALVLLLGTWLQPGNTTGAAAWLASAVSGEQHLNTDKGMAPAHAEHAPGLNPVHPSHWLIILSATLVLAGGLFIAYSEDRLCEELARRYEHMRRVVERRHQSFEQLLKDDRVPWDDKRAQAQRLLRELGREALSENSQWLILRRTHRFKAPVPG